MNRKVLRIVLLILGALLAFLPRILSAFFNLTLPPTAHTLIFIGAVVFLVSGMIMNSEEV